MRALLLCLLLAACGGGEPDTLPDTLPDTPQATKRIGVPDCHTNPEICT